MVHNIDSNRNATHFPNTDNHYSQDMADNSRPTSTENGHEGEVLPLVSD
jgi:hypothetical protein